MGFFAQDTWDGRTYIGAWQRLGKEHTVISPVSGDAIARIPVGTPTDVGLAVTLAATAQAEWAVTEPGERAAVMLRSAELVEKHRDTLIGWLADETGSATGKANFELGILIAEFQQAAATAMMPYGNLLRTAQPRLSLMRRLPVGVVGVIAPFNVPTVLAVRSVAPALALGNAVVLKPDPRSTISGGLFIAAILERAGLPAGLFSVVPGGRDVGEALVDHPRVPVISFTGSTAAGRAIGARGAERLKRVHLELGGNNALAVLADADVEAAAAAGAWGSFLHQGQICMTTGRHLVHESLYERYVELLADRANRLRVGAPASGAELGPIIDAAQRDRVHSIVQRSIEAGATLEAGGEYDGLMYRPTVLSGVKVEHAAFAEELFGPVAPVTPFASHAELEELVNATPYGLSLGVLTGDAFGALQLADRFRSGILHINDQTVDDEAQAPFGGVGDSGTGARFGGHEANIEAFTEIQWVTVRGDIASYPR